MASQQLLVDIDAALLNWRQGDAVRASGMPFLHLADLSMPITSLAAQLAYEEGGGGPSVVSAEVLGLVVVSQTCDILRSCEKRPYVEVCPLVKISDQHIDMLQKGRLGQFASLPGLEDRSLAADLDRVMTIEKSLLLIFTSNREDGLITESQRKRFAEALGRKRTRAALPNDVVVSLKKVRDCIIKQHSKDAELGKFLRAVREIRINPRPDWASPQIDIELLFIFDTLRNIPDGAEDFIEELLGHFIASDSVVCVDGRAVGLDNLSAAAYLQSDRLEFDDLSDGH